MRFRYYVKEVINYVMFSQGQRHFVIAIHHACRNIDMTIDYIVKLFIQCRLMSVNINIQTPSFLNINLNENISVFFDQHRVPVVIDV